MRSALPWRFDGLIHSLPSTMCAVITGRLDDFEKRRSGLRRSQEVIVPSDCINLLLGKGDPLLHADTQDSLLYTAITQRHRYLCMVREPAIYWKLDHNLTKEVFYFQRKYNNVPFEAWLSLHDPNMEDDKRETGTRETTVDVRLSLARARRVALSIERVQRSTERETPVVKTHGSCGRGGRPPSWSSPGMAIALHVECACDTTKAPVASHIPSLRQGKVKHRRSRSLGIREFKGREMNDEDPMPGIHRVFCVPQGDVCGSSLIDTLEV